MKLTFLSILMLTFSIGLSQNSFIIVNQDSIFVTVFKKQYQNNIQAEGLDKAVETYITFKLLQQEAEKSRIDTTAVFRKIYAESMQPEREKYLYNSKIKENLIQDLWEKLQTDRKIELHAIGITNPFDINEKKERDLLAQDLYQQVCKNKLASKRVQEYRNQYKDKVIWMRPLMFSQEIEEIAYATPLGECSPVQPSENGYFFLKVLEERPSAGILTLDYIFNQNKDDLLKAEKELKNKGNWEEIKAKYNKPIRGKGYDYKPRWEADIPIEFLTAINQISSPPYTDIFAGKDGFYLIEVFKHQKFDEIENWKDWIASRITQSDYSLNYVRNVEERAKQVVKVEEDIKALNELLESLGDHFFSSKKEIAFTSDENIWSTDQLSFTQQDLIKELNLSRQFLDENTDFNKFISATIPKYKTQFTLNAYLSDLSKYEPDYADASNLLKQAIKVNNLIEYEIYANAEKDTLGMKDYLKNHATEFTWPVRYDLEIYRYKNPEDESTLVKMLKKKKSSEEILKHFEGDRDENGAIAVVLTKGKFSMLEKDMPKDFNPKKKIQILTFRNIPAIFKLNKKLKSQPKTFNEAFKELKEVYKMHVYEETLKKLRDNATISIPETF